MTDQPAACRTTQHCATHGFCHRCAPHLAEVSGYLTKAIDAAGITSGSGRVYAALAATIRDAARQAAGQPAGEPVDPDGYQGECPCAPSCGCCKAEPAEEPDPTIADDPVQLRWGLGDVLWGDDDSVKVCFSGPDREPYWLELDPERAAALRDDLAPPAAEQTEPTVGDAQEMLRRMHAAAGLAAPTNHNTEAEEDARRELYAYATITFHETGIPESARAYVTRLIATYRAAILNSAADAAHALSLDDYPASSIAARLRRLAAGAES